MCINIDDNYVLSLEDMMASYRLVQLAQQEPLRKVQIGRAWPSS